MHRVHRYMGGGPGNEGFKRRSCIHTNTYYIIINYIVGWRDSWPTALGPREILQLARTRACTDRINNISASRLYLIRTPPSRTHVSAATRPTGSGRAKCTVCGWRRGGAGGGTEWKVRGAEETKGGLEETRNDRKRTERGTANRTGRGVECACAADTSTGCRS